MGTFASRYLTLAANVTGAVDVPWDDTDAARVEVSNIDDASPVYFKFGGTGNLTTKENDSHALPAASSGHATKTFRLFRDTSNNIHVRALSAAAGTIRVSVSDL